MNETHLPLTLRTHSVLDHGTVRLIESWGSDEGIIESARLSTGGKGFLGWGPECKECRCNIGYEANQRECNVCGNKLVPGDEKLLRYLWENKHATPFEMAGATFEVQLPIFVVREWHRHRTQSYSEASARYAPLPDVNYVPAFGRLITAPGIAITNKQAGALKGADLLTEAKARVFIRKMENHYAAAQALYEEALGDGVPKELARIGLPVGRYTRMRASANLRNWLGFLILRDDVNAQWEIQQYARTVSSVLAACFPRTLSLFQEKR